MINYEFNKSMLYVYLDLNHKKTSKSIPVKFLVDTGATYSSVSTKDLAELGYTKEDIEESQFFTKLGLADRSKLDGYVLHVGITHFFNILIPQNLEYSFLVKYKDSEGKVGGFNSLLGMDVLSCLKMTIDPSNEIFELEQVSSLEKRNIIHTHTKLMQMDKLSKIELISEVKRLSIFT